MITYLSIIIGETSLNTMYRALKQRMSKYSVKVQHQTPKWVADGWKYFIAIHVLLLLIFEIISYSIINNIYPILVIYNIYLFSLISIICIMFTVIHSTLRQRFGTVITQLENTIQSQTNDNSPSGHDNNNSNNNTPHTN